MAMDGIDEIGMFANHGFSEIGWFRLLENCPPPMSVRGEATGNRQMTIRWRPYHQHQSFIVQYRVRSYQCEDVFPWHSVEVRGYETTISGLRPEWTYLYRVGALCGMMREPVFADIGQVTLPLHDPALLARCAEPHIPREIYNFDPIESLRVGDVVYVGGGKPMVLTEVTPLGNGWFSGRGVTTTVFFLTEIDFYTEFDRLRINTDRFQIDGTANVVRCPNWSQVVDLTRPQVPQGGGIVFETVTLDFTLPDIPVMTYNVETGELRIYCVNGIPNVVQVPRNEQGESVFPIEVIDENGNRFKVDLVDDDGDNSINIQRVIASEGRDDSNLFFGVDTIAAAQRVSEIIPVLIQRINDRLYNATEQFPNLAFRYRYRIKEITSFNPDIGGGGAFINNRAYIGRGHFVRGSCDEDIKAVIYHEFMHYISWQIVGNRYRMYNLETGLVHQIVVLDFEHRMQSEDEFLNHALSSFIFNRLVNQRDIELIEFYSNFPVLYSELDEVQQRKVDAFIKENDMRPEVVYFRFDYSPSMFFRCEINAHQQTLNAHDRGVFTMSDRNIEFYRSEIARYYRLYNRAVRFETENNINRDGYER